METGRTKDELVRDAVLSYVEELTQVREMLDRRHDEVKNGRVKAIDGEDVFAQLRTKRIRAHPAQMNQLALSLWGSYLFNVWFLIAIPCFASGCKKNKLIPESRNLLCCFLSFD
jgi:hypothetical protein